jgi:ABC-type Na+ transport system ATPase subunit NatA
LQGINQQHEQSRKPNSTGQNSPSSLEMGEAIIEVRNLSKKFGSFTAVDNISFEVYKGDFWFSWGKWSWKNNCHENAHRDLTLTSGEAVVAGYDVKSATEMVKKSIGYEPKNSPCMMT